MTAFGESVFTWSQRLFISYELLHIYFHGYIAVFHVGVHDNEFDAQSEHQIYYREAENTDRLQADRPT